MSIQHAERLIGVHPDLLKVVNLAAQSIDVMVIEGVRSKDQAAINYGKGRTVAECLAKSVPAACAKPNLAKVTWLNHPYATQHSMKADGFGHAVDLLPAPFSWADMKAFGLLAVAMIAASKELHIPIRWGGDWNGNGVRQETGETDLVHFELMP